MVFKALAGGLGGDLGNSTDFFGYFADTILITDNSNYSIFTYEKNDVIDASRVTATGSHQVYAGSGNDIFFGNSSSDQLIDGGGNDRGTLGAGADVWFAGSGNDIVDGGAGADWVYFIYDSFDGLGSLVANTSGVTLDLAVTTVQGFGAFGSDIIKNFENVYGGDGNDVFFGNAGANSLYGSAGNDRLDGRGGNDGILGGDGKDIVTGGRGADNLNLADGGTARDIVKFNAMNESGISVDAQRDQIFNFDAGGTATDDKIDLSVIDARSALAGNQAFVFRGSDPFSSSAGEVRLEIVGSDTLVHVDNDNDLADEMTFWVRGVTTLAAVDFVL